MLFKKPIFNRGISMVELVVTIAIFVLITSVVLISYPQLSSQLALEKTTQDIASTLHETRMYGIGVKSFGEVVTGFVRTRGYGVHFESGNNKSYTLFSDVDNNHQYNPSGIEKSSEFKINGSETILDVCVITTQNTSADSMCSSSGDCMSASGSTIKSVDILFARPAPLVFINGFDADDITVCPGATGSETCGRAIIIIKSPRGNCKKVEAWTTGQVSIQSKTTP